MCLYLQKNARLMTPKKPVHIYKLITYSPAYKTFVTPFQRYPVKFGKKGTATMRAKIGEMQKLYYCNPGDRIIEKGIHAYSKYNIAKDEADYKGFDKLCHAVIPVGANYYNDENHEEVVADKIIIFDTYELYKKYMAKWDK